MIIVLIGPPGSGKGTYAQLLAKKGWVHFSMGQVLREYVNAGGPFAKEIARIQATGQLVPSRIFFPVFVDYMKKHRSKNIVLDGMPRTMEQAVSMSTALKSIKPVDAFLFIDAHEDEIKDRLRKRRQCSKCGKVFGKVVKPKKKGLCDRCGGKLQIRNDDKPSVIHERFRVYNTETAPVVDWASEHYPVFYIDGHGTPGVVFKRIQRVLSILK